jgi:hypothetical protein
MNLAGFRLTDVQEVLRNYTDLISMNSFDTDSVRNVTFLTDCSDRLERGTNDILHVEKPKIPVIFL